jgi:transposase
MDPLLIDLLEPAVVFATMLGAAFGVKLLIWGKGPIKRRRLPPEDPALEQRVADLEERLERSSELLSYQANQLDDLNERLEFHERVIARQRAEEPKALDKR